MSRVPAYGFRTVEEGLAVIDSLLYCEWLPPGARCVGSSWDWKAEGWRWLKNIPQGPRGEGIAVLTEVLEVHGAANVLTGNAADPATREPGPSPVKYAPGQVGVYVRAGS